MDVPIYRLDRYSLPQPQSPLASAAVELEITRGRVRQRVRPVHSKIFLIGAANDCDLVLGDLQFPEAFAYLFVNGSEVSIRRLGTGPELLVNGQLAQAAELFHGDLVAFGPFELRVRLAAESHDQRDPCQTDRAAAQDEVEALLLDIRRGLAEEPAIQQSPRNSASPAGA